jgi:hypothetical protein
MGGSLRRRISKVSHQAAELSGEVDLGDLGAALATEAFFNRLVALGVERVLAGVRWLVSG